jgi:FkbM family methyltransferase
VNSLARRISKLPNYARRFGALHGVRLFRNVERKVAENRERVERLNVPGYPTLQLRDTISDHAIFWQCIVQCQYDFLAFPQASRLKRAYVSAVSQGVSPLIIDCGANIGLASVWFAKTFPEARIYAIEPDKRNFEMLQTNTAAFGKRVTPVQGAIWHERDSLRIVNPEAGSAAFRVSLATSSPHDAVPAFRIDDICEMAHTRVPLVVKLDIEGAQASLFSANTDWVGNTHLITLELDDWLFPWQGTSRSFFATLSRYPFDYLIRGESIFCFRDFGEPVDSDWTRLPSSDK